MSFTILNIYKTTVENILAIPVVVGKKTNSEKFAPKRDNVIILDSKKLYNTSDISKISVDDVLKHLA